MDGSMSFNTTNLTSVLSDLNTKISDFAAEIVLDPKILFGIGIALAAIIGLFGYKMIKLILSLSMAYVGYEVGADLIALVAEKIEGTPAWMEYVCGGLIDVVLLAMAFAKFSYVWFGSAAVLGYMVMTMFVPSTYGWLALGGALLIAMLAVMLIRTMFVLATSFISGALCVSFLSAMFPNWTLLNLGESAYAIWFVCGVAILFALVQFISNRYRGETLA